MMDLVIGSLSKLSPKMAAKRLSDTDVIYPPKKRALYEHMKLNGIQKFSASQISPNGIMGYQENLDIYGMRLPLNLEIKPSETYTRPRSDSLQSEISSNSDRTETGSTESRETSPCTIQTLPVFDHHTPERNPITSLDGLKRDISKPLFPVNDNVNYESRSSPEIQKFEGSEGKKLENSVMVNDTSRTLVAQDGRKNDRNFKAVVRQKTVKENIPGKMSETFHEHTGASSSFQNTNIPAEDENVNAKENVALEESHRKPREVYMGPMVSLLNRFNAEVLNGNTRLEIKEQSLPPGDVEKSGDQTVLCNQNLPLTYSHKHLEHFGHLQNFENGEKNQIQSNEINTDVDEKAVCKVCNKVFSTRAFLFSHMRTHENRSIQCWMCKEVFQTAEMLNVHMKLEHKGENPYKCEHCSREFTQYNNLRRHMRVHRENVYKCNLCNREFNEEFYLKMHMGTHTGKRVYSCGVCGEGFPSNHDLKMHVKTHSPSLLHTCNVCGKSFSKACVLRQHKKGHSGERPHKCDKCEKTFIHRHHLTMHLKSHVDEKRLSCDVCKKEFSQHSHLYKHLRSHEDDKNYRAGGNSIDTSENQTCEKLEVPLTEKVKMKQLPKVVLLPNDCTTLKCEIGKKDKFDNVQKKDKQQKRVRRTTPQNSLPPASQTMVPTSTSESSTCRRPLPSISQTFGHEMSRYPNIPFMQGMPQNYPTGSPSHPLSLYNPLPRNEVPASLPGYQHYGQIYNNYSDQMQAYYKNMYMMNYLSHNAFLHNSQIALQKSQNVLLQNYQNTLLQNATGEGHEKIQGQVQLETESIYISPDQADAPNITKPGDVLRIEKLKSKQIKEAGKESDVEKINTWETEPHSVSVGNQIEDIDVVNMKVENEDETTSNVSRRDEEKSVKLDMNAHAVAKSKEHEVAQELLKMSAWNEAHVPKSDEKIREKEVIPGFEKQDKGKSVQGMNFTHCINDIIKRTIRSNDWATEYSVNVPKPENVGTRKDQPEAENVGLSIDGANPVAAGTLRFTQAVDNPITATTQQITVSEQQRTSICESTSDTRVHSYESHLQTLGSDEHLNSRPEHVNGIRNLTLSPLEKLEMFVASEKTNFDKAESLNTSSDSLFDKDASELINNFWSDKDNQESVFVPGKPENKLSEELKESVKNNEVEAGNENQTIEETLEERLEKIRKFASIGHMLSRVQSEFHEGNSDYQNLEKGESFLGENVEIEKDNISEIQLEDPINESQQQVNDNWNGAGTCNGRIDVVGNHEDDQYFNDSLEERHLEIVEGDSLREGERHTELSETDNSEDLDKSANKGLVLNETDFLSHMSDVLRNKDVEIQDQYRHGQNVEETIANDAKSVKELELVNEQTNLVMDTNVEEQKDNLSVNHDESELKLKPWTEVVEKFDGAVDLRTDTRQSDFRLEQSEIKQRFENENVPMDLSVNGVKRCVSEESNAVKEKLKVDNEKIIRSFGLTISQCGNKYYTCKFCEKTFQNSETWAEHENLHKTMDKPYICNICHRAFSQRHNLNRHKMSHNSKSYECNVCHRSFKESFYLQMHMKTHAEENIQMCQICSQNVPKTEIWQHTSQHLGNISENPTYQQIGNRVQEILHGKNLNVNRETENVEMDRHSNGYTIQMMNGARKERRPDIKAGMTHNIEEVLNLKKENIENWDVAKGNHIGMTDMHKLFHQNVHDIRGASVLNERKLEDRNVDTRPVLQCTLCKKILHSKHALSNHMDFHKGTRPFLCKICGRAFKKRKGLQIHGKLHLESSVSVLV